MKNLLILLFSILISSCSLNDDNVEMINIDSILIAKSNLLGNGIEGITEQNFIITDQTAWSDLISQMDLVNNVSDNFTETDVEFAEYTIIAVFAAIKRHAGHSLQLDIMANSENILVNIKNLVPRETKATVITQPFYIVKIKNSDLPILFQ